MCCEVINRRERKTEFSSRKYIGGKNYGVAKS